VIALDVAAMRARLNAAIAKQGEHFVRSLAADGLAAVDALEAAQALVAELETKVAEQAADLASWDAGWERLGVPEKRPPIEFTGLNMTPGKAEIRFRPDKAFQVISTALIQFLDGMNAKNCVESVGTFKGKDYVIDVRRLTGKAMAQLKAEAEAEADRLRTENAALRAVEEAAREVAVIHADGDYDAGRIDDLRDALAALDAARAGGG